MSNTPGAETIEYRASTGSFGTPFVKSSARSEIERKPFGASGMPVSPAWAIPFQL